MIWFWLSNNIWVWCRHWSASSGTAFHHIDVSDNGHWSVNLLTKMSFLMRNNARRKSLRTLCVGVYMTSHPTWCIPIRFRSSTHSLGYVYTGSAGLCCQTWNLFSSTMLDIYVVPQIYCLWTAFDSMDCRHFQEVPSVLKIVKYFIYLLDSGFYTIVLTVSTRLSWPVFVEKNEYTLQKMDAKRIFLAIKQN